MCTYLLHKWILSGPITKHHNAAQLKLWTSHKAHYKILTNQYPPRIEWTNQVPAFSDYRKERFLSQQAVKIKNRSKWRKNMIETGVLVILGVGVCVFGVVYHTITSIKATYTSFFPQGSCHRGMENYIPSQSESQVMLLPWVSWLQTYSTDLWTLLRLCESDDRKTRHLGVQALAEQHQWSDGEYVEAAQAMDTRTVVGLARMRSTDHRLFLAPPCLPPKQNDLEIQLRDLLVSLPTDDLDKCTQYFTANALKEISKPTNMEERGTIWSFSGSDHIQAECDLGETVDLRREIFSLLALKAHSEVANTCRLIVKLGGLQVLRRLHDVRGTSVTITRHIACIISTLSYYTDLHTDIITAGWVSILSDWMRSGDFTLKLQATKALSNLDRDCDESPLYPDSVYLYHPQYRSGEVIYADVVFIHGLLGGPSRTWRQHDSMRPENRAQQDTASSQLIGEPTAGYTHCWPQDWLAVDCPHLRLLTVDFETHLSQWSPECPYESEKRTLLTRSKQLLEKLRAAGVGDRPIIWVGHSMGGLLIKQMLLLADQEASQREILERTCGMVFYSVPHQGSPLAAYSNHTKFPIYPSVEVKQLDQGSEDLVRLHTTFKDLMFDAGIPLLSFGEGRKTDLPLNVKVIMVPEQSSDPGFGEFHLMKELSHLTVCKPVSKHSALYTLTLGFIQHCIQIHEVQQGNKPEDNTFPTDFGENWPNS